MTEQQSVLWDAEVLMEQLTMQHSRPRKEIEDEVLAIELKIRKESLGVIDGGKS